MSAEEINLEVVAQDRPLINPFVDEELLPAPVLDGSTVKNILQDRQIGPQAQSGRLAHYACQVFAEQIGIDPGLAPEPDTLVSRYFSAASQLRHIGSKATDVAAVADFVAEELQPLGRRVPTAVSAEIVRRNNLQDVAHTAHLIVSLWTLEYLGVEMPTVLERMIDPQTEEERAAARIALRTEVNTRSGKPLAPHVRF